MRKTIPIVNVLLPCFIFLLFAVPGVLLAQKKEVPSIGGTYLRPLEFNPKTLDPALSVDIHAVTVIQQIFDGLVQFDKDLNIIPAVAKSWTISSDGLTYTFYLKEGVKFHNGREVNAKDFVYSFTRILDPGIKSSSADFFSRVIGAKEFADRKTKEIKGLIAQGKNIFKIILSEAYAPLITMLAMKGAKVVPQEEIERKGIDFNKNPVGTGPFRFVSMKEGEEIVLEANDSYFEGRPYLDRIIFKIFHGAPREEILRRFKERELEDSFVPFRDVEEISRSKYYVFVHTTVRLIFLKNANCHFILE